MLMKINTLKIFQKMLFSNNVSFIMFFYFLYLLQTSENSQCVNKYLSYKIFPFSNDTWSIFSQFSSFSNLLSSSSNCSLFYNITNYLEFIPSKPCILDTSFKVGKLFSKQMFSVEKVSITNLKGIDVHTMPLKLFGIKSYLQIFSSCLNFYKNSTHMIDASNECDLITFDNTFNFLNSFNDVRFDNVIYPNVFCPFAFKDSNINRLDFTGITNSFIFKNRLKFYILNETINTNSNGIMKSIHDVVLSLTYEALDENMLSVSLFKTISILAISGVLHGIKEDLFKEFYNLRSIQFKINNFRDFFHSGFKWLNYLNRNVKYSNSTRLDVNNVIFLRFFYPKNLISFDEIYDYPNQDICLFKNFPHSRLVLADIVPGRGLNCTCLLMWLQFESKIYEEIRISTYNYNLNDQNDQETGGRYIYLFCGNTSLKCNFSEIFNSCELNTNQLNQNSEPFFKSLNDVDVLFLIKWLQFILLTILQPILCSIGIINNLINIIVIENKTKKKDFNQAMYRFIEINSIFNMIYCSIRILNLINTCIFSKSSVFCSSIYEENSSQYFKIIFIHFLGNAMKLSSNYSYLLFALTRLILITFEKDNNVARNHKRIYYFVYFLIIFFISCVFSVFKLFQYSINESFFAFKDFPYEIRDEFYCNDEQQSIKFQCGLFRVFKLLNTFLNDILLIIFNIIIDIVLLWNFHLILNRKLTQIIDIEHQMNIRKSKKKMNRMILFNSFLYLFSHLPEFLTTLMLIVYSKKILNFCQYNLSCDLINEEAEFFGLISIASQFYVYRLFDKNYKASYLNLKSRYGFCQNQRNKQIMAQNARNTMSFELSNLNNLIGNGLIE